MITAICSAIFLGLGIWYGFNRSERKFGRMCDDGQIVFRYEDKDGGGWDGEPEALADLRKWVKRNEG